MPRGFFLPPKDTRLKYTSASTAITSVTDSGFAIRSIRASRQTCGVGEVTFEKYCNLVSDSGRPKEFRPKPKELILRMIVSAGSRNRPKEKFRPKMPISADRGAFRPNFWPK